ncbi:uncharacterized protein LOC110703697 [Chenopodium quinoa]|uniref:uncharacterized protein LOC110703697 n=1 Tax=Chenopodium quinoa TaxID=63459 RepID=UPI000B778740|nr:uncharacterized protein LOC110703697 [Chenopodium quinoa]
MSSEETSNSSNSSSSSENSQTQRYERRRQANRLVNRMMDEVFMSNPIEVYQMLNQVPRAPRIPIPRDHEDGHNRFWNDYFADHPVFPPQLFRRRFRMNKHIFLRIKKTLEELHPFFQQRQDATGRFGASGLQKCTTAMRLIAYGTSADSVNGYIRISASLARDSLQHFVEGSSRNDINVLDRSPLFNDVFEGRAPSINYVVNDHQYNMGYYLIDGIYPKWVAFIPTISLPQNEKEGLFAKL